jgi:hypothetical protein
MQNLQTGYTEVDVASNRVVLAGAKATITDLDGDEIVSVYKDFGANYFNALNIFFEFNYTGASHGTGNPSAYAIQLTGSAITSALDPAITDLVVCAEINSGSYNLWLLRGCWEAYDGCLGLSTDTVYYCKLVRAAASSTITLTIYSDAARTNVVDTLSVTGYGTDKCFESGVGNRLCGQ